MEALSCFAWDMDRRAGPDPVRRIDFLVDLCVAWRLGMDV